MDGEQSGGPATPGTKSAKWRILCIDDEPELLSLLRMTLSMRHEVVTAPGGLEALRIIGVSEPDFVICDVRMPDMDGYATVQAIRKHPQYADIPVFFLTAEKGKDAARRGYESGCNLYLYKPFDAMRLLENIDYFTRESGHTIRPKSHTLEELEPLLETARKAPAQPAVAAAPEPAPPPPPQPPDETPPTPITVVEAEPLSNAERRTEHEAFLADRKRREREFWQKRYAAIQEFIDQHMT